MAAAAAPGGGNWAVGLTPERVAAVWLRGAEGSTDGLVPESGAVPLSSAVLQYASRELPTAGWDRPAEVAQVEVCDPSGLLPTEHCPQVVTEIYLQGTEPTAFDNLYQPFEINRETGRLATLQTPVELIEERVYLVPPPEAAEWAEAVGLERPPREYDRLSAGGSSHPNVVIGSPEGFEVLKGRVSVRGEAHPPDFDYFRLHYGEGLNPSHWTQIGEDQSQRVLSGQLGVWDTGALSGLYTLQLVVVLEDGTLLTDSIAVTVDNQPPSIRLLRPAPDEMIETGPLTLEASASDAVGLAAVTFYLDGELVGSLERAPFVLELPLPEDGRHELYATARDAVGNEAESERLSIEVDAE